MLRQHVAATLAASKHALQSYPRSPYFTACCSDLEDGGASEEEPDFDAELATAGADSSDNEEVRAILRGSGTQGSSGSDDEQDEQAGGSGSSDDEEAEDGGSGSGSEDEGGLQLMGGEHGESDSDDEFDLDVEASEGSDEE